MASTGAERTPWTSVQTLRSSDELLSQLSAVAAKVFWIFHVHSNTLRLKALALQRSRMAAMAMSSSRLFGLERAVCRVHSQLEMRRRPQLLFVSELLPYIHLKIFIEILVTADAQSSLGVSSGFLFANPIPARFSIPKETIDNIMFQAIQDAEKSGVTGSENTPFILSKIREITHGDTVIANRSLVEENIKRGTRVAVELAALELEEQGAPYR